jgi:hypothetical protein
VSDVLTINIELFLIVEAMTLGKRFSQIWLIM